MSTIWDKIKREDYKDVIPEEEIFSRKSESLENNGQTEVDKNLKHLDTDVFKALNIVDDVVMKNYLTKLRSLPVVKTDEILTTNDLFLYKVNKIVYEKDEYATDKFASVISALTFAQLSVFLLLDGYDDTTDFYLGIKGKDENHTGRYLAETLANALKGQFPGIAIEDFSVLNENTWRRKSENLLDRIAQSGTISACTCVPSLKDKKGNYTNASFIQGIEKLALAMRGKRYTAIILAENIDVCEIQNIRNGYEVIYEQLSLKATQQMSYSTNETLANALSRTNGTSHSTSKSHSEGRSDSLTEGISDTKSNKAGKMGKMSSVLTSAGAILSGTSIGGAVVTTGLAAAMPAVGLGLLGLGVVGTLAGTSGEEQQGSNQSSTTSISANDSHSISDSESFSETNGITSTIGSTKSFTITRQDKHIQELLKRIDKQLERLTEFESTGLWSTGAYFMSYDNDRATAETGAAIYKSIIQGENSGVESSAINTWHENDTDFKGILDYVSCMEHPLFEYCKDILGNSVYITPTSMISSKEISLMIGLPRKSVPGLLVRQQATFGDKVVTEKEYDESFLLGYVSNLDNVSENNSVKLAVNSLASHTFITGSTGCGKSNTVYLLLDSLLKMDKKFMVIEPAKGEYKNVFGHIDGVKVYGTNPNIMEMLKINPFAFPERIHVEEHIERLVDIFSACWPMYAAMPAVLKKSITNAYISCGWDMVKSRCVFDIYPTFNDVIRELNKYVNSSEYSADSKSDYKGALGTRLESLTNGIVGQIFDDDLLPIQKLSDNLLFNNNVIVDLSRVGSIETKALIMGVLVIRLNEFRMSEGLDMNQGLRHVTVLEEAHHLLKATSTEQLQEDSNVLGKSVQMISSSIAEMRTYGEGFIIVDQTPTMLDKSAINNTNTKIILTLPGKDDRDVAGDSLSLTDEQKSELSKLRTGFAVVFQKGWEEAVLCRIERFMGKTKQYKNILALPTVNESTIIDKKFIESLPDDDVSMKLIDLFIQGYDGEDGNITFDQLCSAINCDHSLTGKQRYDLFVKLFEIKENMMTIKDACAILFTLYIGVEGFAEISSSSSDINDFNAKVCQLIRNSWKVNDYDEDKLLEMYVKGCCELNVTNFFEEWFRQTYNMNNVK